MKEALKLKSKSGIHRLISALEERGFSAAATTVPGRSRCCGCPETLPAAPAPPSRALETASAANFSPNVIRGDFTPKISGVRAANEAAAIQLPLYGRIAAGLPIEALRDRSTVVDMPVALLGNGEHYRARGRRRFDGRGRHPRRRHGHHPAIETAENGADRRRPGGRQRGHAEASAAARQFDRARAVQRPARNAHLPGRSGEGAGQARRALAALLIPAGDPCWADGGLPDPPRMSSPLPSVDALLRTQEAAVLAARFGRAATVSAIRAELGRLRAARRLPRPAASGPGRGGRCAARCGSPRSQRPVFNLTGTVLHTNLGRAPMPAEAAEAAVAALRSADHAGIRPRDRAARRARRPRARPPARADRRRGRDGGQQQRRRRAARPEHARRRARGARSRAASWWRSAARSGCPTSWPAPGRGWSRSAPPTARIARDYGAAIGAATALLLRVHPSNYAIAGFTAAVPLRRTRADRPRGAACRCVEDLGSGSLVDLVRLGAAARADVPRGIRARAPTSSCFSGDKLLGGPQAGLIVGRAELIARAQRQSDEARAAARQGAAGGAGTRAAPLSEARAACRPPARPAPAQPRGASHPGHAERVAPRSSAPSRIAPCPSNACQSQIGSGALPLDLLAFLRGHPRRRRLWRASRPGCAPSPTGDRPHRPGAGLARLPLSRAGRRTGLRGAAPASQRVTGCRGRTAGRSSPLEEKRSRWAGRPSKPVGAAMRSRVGSTPALFRRLATAACDMCATLSEKRITPCSSRATGVSFPSPSGGTAVQHPPPAARIA